MENKPGAMLGKLSVGLRDRFMCPECRVPIKVENEPIKCDKCGKIYGKNEGFIDFLTNDGLK